MSDWPLAPRARLAWAVSAITRSSVSMPLRSSLAGFRRRGVVAVQPLHMLMIGDVPVEQQLITEQLGDAVHVPDIAPGPGGSLDADRAGRAPCRVAGQAVARRQAGLGRRGQFRSQRVRVLDSLAGALRQVLQHGMGGVAEQRNPAASSAGFPQSASPRRYAWLRKTATWLYIWPERSGYCTRCRPGPIQATTSRRSACRSTWSIGMAPR